MLRPLLYANKKVIIMLFLVSSLIFLYYLSVNYNVNYYDEKGYLNISKKILANGLFSINEPLRTYFYPLVLSCVSIFTNGDAHVIKIIMSVFQYLFYVYTIWFVAAKSFEYSNNKRSVLYSILFFGFLNPYLIQSTTLFLTDVLASCCVILALTYLVFGNFERNKTYILIFGFSYVSTMIRPSSIVIIPVIIMLIIVRKIIIKDVNLSKGLVFGISALVIFFPQLYNNVIQFNDWTPLVHSDLYEFQSNLAASNLKYGTVVIPNEAPQLFYPSPYLVDSLEIGILELIFVNFPAFLVAYSSHLFGVLDWGYIETYINDYYPISRIFGSLFLYLFWITSFYGLYKFIRNERSVQARFFVASFIGTFAVYWLFIGTTIIESRFGYPLYFMILPFSGYCLWSWLEFWRNRDMQNAFKMKKTMTYLFVSAALIALLFYLSFLLDYQTGRINWLGF
ncbi:hypothetical protein [Paenibacillus woosongensis]|uniref:Glycosyltransferase RgtA/B/C/D-like domain-containing protein n=1 Tax=Paenibacillus woosongensis TaxID=307580 RepID=A0ABQ4MWH5_9BACL|nr:hypothetical protein [Paenibacillus woosongensis]GIP60272.1 hypothetical protein J15TS10_40860 [Paenibacillus woosongensis]